MEHPALIWKTAVVGTAVVATNVVGNYALRVGLSRVGALESWSPFTYIRVLYHPWVAVGVVFMIAWLATRLALLSWADLSYVLPVTSISYALTALAGALWLHEHVTWVHWAGIVVITSGVGLVASTHP